MANAAMATGDYPAMASSNYASTTYGLGDLNQGAVFNAGTTAVSPFFNQGNFGAQPLHALARTVSERRLSPHPTTTNEAAEEAGAMANQSKRRLVQVLIVDPNENIPLEQCLLYRGEQKLTDATDQELFFELDIKDILAKHNEARIKIVDKKVKERTEYLEPAKIRDLKMVVVTVAEF